MPNYPLCEPAVRWASEQSCGSSRQKRRDDVAAIVNGLFGDKLDDSVSRWSTPMTIRAGDTVVARNGRALPDALGGLANVGPRICLLVHGLMSTESIWNFPDAPSTTYGRLLADDHDVTVLSVRYNTGRHISTNGRELARAPQPPGVGVAGAGEGDQPDRSQHGRARRAIGLSLRTPHTAARSAVPDRASLDQQSAPSRPDRGAQYRRPTRDTGELRQRRPVVAADPCDTARRTRPRPAQRGHQGPPLRRHRRRGLARAGSQRPATHLPPPAAAPPPSRPSRRSPAPSPPTPSTRWPDGSVTHSSPPRVHRDDPPTASSFDERHYERSPESPTIHWPTTATSTTQSPTGGDRLADHPRRERQICRSVLPYRVTAPNRCLAKWHARIANSSSNPTIWPNGSTGSCPRNGPTSATGTRRRALNRL